MLTITERTCEHGELFEATDIHLPAESLPPGHDDLAGTWEVWGLMLSELTCDCPRSMATSHEFENRPPYCALQAKLIVQDEQRTLQVRLLPKLVADVETCPTWRLEIAADDPIEAPFVLLPVAGGACGPVMLTPAQ